MKNIFFAILIAFGFIGCGNIEMVLLKKLQSMLSKS